MDYKLSHYSITLARNLNYLGMKLPALLTISNILPTVVADGGTCRSQACRKNHPLAQGLRASAISNNFGLIPLGGWSAHVTVSGGLEWLYALPIIPASDYYSVRTGDVVNTPCCCSGSTFPPCVEASGFRLPTRAEVSAFLPSNPPECMAEFCYDFAPHCDVEDYLAGYIAVADESEQNGCDETVYVRPVGSLDRCGSDSSSHGTSGGKSKGKAKPKPKPTSAPHLSWV